MFSRATVLGKLRTYLHLSLKVRLSADDPRSEWGKKLQVIVNDVARVVIKKRRSDHVRVEDDVSVFISDLISDSVCKDGATCGSRCGRAHDVVSGMDTTSRK